MSCPSGSVLVPSPVPGSLLSLIPGGFFFSSLFFSWLFLISRWRRRRFLGGRRDFLCFFCIRRSNRRFRGCRLLFRCRWFCRRRLLGGWLSCGLFFCGRRRSRRRGFRSCRLGRSCALFFCSRLFLGRGCAFLAGDVGRLLCRCFFEELGGGVGIEAEDPIADFDGVAIMQQAGGFYFFVIDLGGIGLAEVFDQDALGRGAADEVFARS